MTPEQINTEIAKWAGWQHQENNYRYQPQWESPTGELTKDVPNYHGDLNAVHEAEKHLRRHPGTFQPGGIGYYLRLLDESVAEPITSTAAQRCEALLRSIGLWIEDKT